MSLPLWPWGEAARNPMFVFTFDRGLFKFRANTPALAPLFQLPPRIGRRFGPASETYFSLFFHAPSIRPISSTIDASIHTFEGKKS